MGTLEKFLLGQGYTALVLTFIWLTLVLILNALGAIYRQMRTIAKHLKVEAEDRKLVGTPKA